MAKKRKLKPKAKRTIIIIFLVLLAFLSAEIIEYIYESNQIYVPYESHKNNYYYAYDFGFLDKKSNYDFNTNGIDDYTEILLGAKKLAIRNPKYVSKYYDGGYPPETEGVCTDAIQEAVDNAGYNLRDMIDYDIRNNRSDYPQVTIVDANIDYRRVSNQYTFFKKYLQSYSNDYEDVTEFNPGDILTFDDADHIAMCSDKRNAKAIPYLIQNRDETQTEKEEDRLEITDMTITGHFRFTYNKKIEKIIKSL